MGIFCKKSRKRVCLQCYVSEIHYQSGRGAEVRACVPASASVGVGRGLPLRRRTVEGGRGPQMRVALRPFVRVRCAQFREGEAHRVVGHRRWSAPAVPLAALAVGRMPGACLCQSLLNGVGIVAVFSLFQFQIIFSFSSMMLLYLSFISSDKKERFIKSNHLSFTFKNL